MNSEKEGVYFKNLDGLRGLAALAVVFFHAANWFPHPDTAFSQFLYQILSFHNSGGDLGVLFFFVLSGFLITYLLFQERLAFGKIGLGNFYMRRLLRIWPLYYLSVAIGFWLFPLLFSQHALPASQNSSMGLYLIFAGNFDHIQNGTPTNGLLGVQWSVAVEEQFYLIWPLLFLLLRRPKAFPVFMMGLLILSEWFYSQSSGQVRYFHFLSNVRFLAFGALLAWMAFFHRSKLEATFTKCKPRIHVLIYLAGLVLLFFQKPLSEVSLILAYGIHVVPMVFFGFVILEQNYSVNSFFKISRIPFLSWLGKISYGLYLTHMIGVYCVLALLPNGTEYYLFKILFSLILTIFISHFSYTYFESYFLKLKSKFIHTKPKTTAI